MVGGTCRAQLWAVPGAHGRCWRNWSSAIAFAAVTWRTGRARTRRLSPLCKLTCQTHHGKVTCWMSGQQPAVIDCARRHGVRDEEMQHAFRNPVRTFLVGEDMTMVIGADGAGRLIEVGVVESRDEPGLVIVHAMPARSKFLKG